MINKCTTIFFEKKVLQVLKILLTLRTYNILSNKPYDDHSIGNNIYCVPGITILKIFLWYNYLGI